MDPKKMAVRDIMIRDVKTIGKADALIDAARTMKELGISSLIVEADDDRDAYGIITRKDIVEAFVNRDIDERSQLVEDIMSMPAIAVNPEMSINNCHLMMRMIGVRRMPVVDGTKLVGIISNSNIFAKMME